MNEDPLTRLTANIEDADAEETAEILAELNSLPNLSWLILSLRWNFRAILLIKLKSLQNIVSGIIV